MWIRDSFWSWNGRAAPCLQPGAGFIPPGPRAARVPPPLSPSPMREGAVPVSYTHLDVYKRQIQDNTAQIVEKMAQADVIVFATPIYYYEMSGQMKTLLDRANPLFPSDYSFRRIYLLTTAAEDEESVPEKAVSGLKGWIDCFEKAALAGTVFAGGVTGAGEIEGHPALKTAYDMGASIQ